MVMPSSTTRYRFDGSYDDADDDDADDDDDR